MQIKGLLIFNTDTKMLEFFDGDIWRSLTPFPKVSNGLSLSAEEKVRLGGRLSEETTITQKGFPLNLAVGNGTFTVEGDSIESNKTLVVDNSNVSFGRLNEFTIKSGTEAVFKTTETSTNSI